jgi:hypothetical protein
MKIIFHLSVLLSCAINLSSCKPKITHYVDETAHEFVLNIPHLKYQEVLTFNKDMKWNLVEKIDGVIVRTQTGNYRIEKTPYTQHIIIDKMYFCYSTMFEISETKFVTLRESGTNLALYFDEVGNLNYSGESGYIYYKK